MATTTKTPKLAPISNAEFLAAAKTLSVQINDGQQGVFLSSATARQFSTGSVGFNASGKGMVVINGKPVQVQINVLCTVIGSKPQA